MSVVPCRGPSETQATCVSRGNHHTGLLHQWFHQFLHCSFNGPLGRGRKALPSALHCRPGKQACPPAPPSHLSELQGAHKGGLTPQAARRKRGVQLGAVAGGEQGVHAARLARKLKPVAVKAADLGPGRSGA